MRPQLAITRHARAACVQLLAIATAALLLAACTPRPSSHRHPRPGARHGTSPYQAAAPDGSPDGSPLGRARLLLAEYNYVGAAAELANEHGPQAKTLLAQVRTAQARSRIWPDDTTISHIFYHSLVVDPARAFRRDTEGVGFSQYMVTQHEFMAQLEQIYRHGYVLVHPERIAAPGANGVMRYLPIVLPPGKKPLVLSLDDTSYYTSGTGRGFANKLVIDPRGRVVNTYTDAAGKTVEGDYDCLPIIDDFVRAHPDFSYHGDKGSIGLTGYEGILGYRTSVRDYGDTAATHHAQREATTVADAIKAEGWNFASHTWGHINMTRDSVAFIRADATRWDSEVRPLIGDTPELIFPFGADISGVTPYSRANAKYVFLHGVEHFDYLSQAERTGCAQPVESRRISGGSWVRLWITAPSHAA